MGYCSIVVWGNSMICSDIWHKYHEWHFEIVIRNIIWENFEISRVVFMPNIKYKSCYYLFTLSTTRKGFEIFTCRYFKLSWNTTALSQSNYINFLWSRDKSGNWSWIELIWNHTCDLKIERERKSRLWFQTKLHFPEFNYLYAYSRTSIERPSIKWSPININLLPMFTGNLTSIQRPPLLSGRGHRLDFPNG